MKPLLILSLAANVAMLGGVVYLATTPPALHPIEARSQPVAPATVPMAAALSHREPDSAVAAAVLPPNLWNSPSEMQAWLRSSGAPLRVRYAIAEAMLRDKYTAAYEAVRFPPGMRRWQRSTTRLTPEQNERLAAIREQQEGEMKQLVGADYLQARYGDGQRLTGIPADKLAEISRIQRNYSEIRQQMGGPTRPEEVQLIQTEMNADLRKVLTPLEYESYQAFDSPEGQQLQRALAGLDIDDAAYLRAFRAVSAEKPGTQRPGFYPTYQSAEIQAIENTLGREAATQVAMNQNSTFRPIAALVTSSGLPATAALGKYQTMLQFYQATEGWGPQTIPTDSQLAQVRSYRERLLEGLSDADRTRFDRTPTGSLMNRLLRGK